LYKCKVIKIIDESENIKSVILEKPENFNYLPGSFAMISVNVNDGFIKRAFSFSSSPTENNLKITIKLNQEGVFTPYIFNQLKINDIIQIKGPYGKMTFNDEENNIILIAAGTGFAPMRSIIKYCHDKKLKNKLYLYYSTKTKNEILFKKDLNDFKNNDLFNLNIHLTQEENNEFKFGRIKNEEIFLNENSLYYICGHKKFVLEITKFLKNKNINNIKIEAW
jgi:NAD(P)H-flavin reductase